MSESKTSHTLHAEHMISIFGTKTFQIICECGEVKAVLSINWGDGVLHLTAIGDEYTIDIRRNGHVSSWRNQ
jgi:hypothetical protein